MTLSKTQISIIIASCTAAVLGIACITLIVTRSRTCFPFSFSQPPLSPNDIEAQTRANSATLQTYGKKQSMKMDVIPHISPNLARTQSATPSVQASQITAGTKSSPKPGRSLLVHTKQAHQLGAPSQRWLDPARRAMGAENAAYRIKAGQWVDVAREEMVVSRLFQEVDVADDAADAVYVVGEEEDGMEAVGQYAEVAVDPMSYSFGSGKAMAKLYS